MAGENLDALLQQLDAQQAPPTGGPSMGAPGPGPAEGLDAMLAHLDAQQGGGSVQTQNAAPAGGPPAPDKYAIPHTAEGIQRSSGIPGVDTLSNFLAGGYNKIADAIGLPVEIINEVMGYAGKEFLDKPGNAQKAIRWGFSKAGLGTYQGAADTIAASIGEEAVTQLLTVAGMRAAAPSMASMPGTAQGGNAVQGAVRTMGEGLIEKPATSVLAAAAAAPGIYGGKQVGEPVGKGIARGLGAEPGGTGERIGGTLGAAVGELAGGTATSLLGTKALGTLLPQNERMSVPQQALPLVDKNAVPTAARDVAEQQVNRQMQIIENRASRELASIAPTARNAEEASIAFSEAYTKSEQLARKIEARLWRDVPTRGPADEGALTRLDRAAVRALNTNEFGPSQAPTTTLGNFRASLARHIEDGETVTVGDLRKLRGDLMHDYVQNRARAPGKVENRPLGKAIIDFVEHVDNAIEASMAPADLAAQQRARAVSRRVNELFTKGEVEILRAQDSSGIKRVRAGAEIPTLLKERYGMSEIHATTDPVQEITSAPGITRERIDFRAQQGRVLKTADEGIRAYFRDKVTEAGDPMNPNVTGGQRLNKMATEAGKFSKDHARRIEDFAVAAGHIDSQTNKLREAVRQHKQWQDSAVMEYTGKTAEAGAKDILNAVDPAAKVAEIRAMLRRPPVPGASPAVSQEAAVAGFQKALVGELLNVDSAARFAQRLEDPRIMSAVRALFLNDPEAVTRLRNMATAAARIEGKEDVSFTDKAGRALTTGLAGAVALHFGHIYAGVVAAGTAYGSLSYPARFNRAMREFVASRFAGQEPVELLKEAVVNPQMERFLNSRLPENLSQARNYRRGLAVLTTGVESATGAAINRYSQDMERAK